MSKSAIYTVNQTPQDVQDGGTINLGTVIRRFGCNLSLSGNGVLVDGAGYYEIGASITLTPAAAGDVTVSLLRDGTEIPGATASVTVADTDETVNLGIMSLFRENCACCEGASNITAVLSGAATVNNVALNVVKL